MRPSDHLSLFLELNDAVPDMSRHLAPTGLWVEDFRSKISELDPIAAEEFCLAMVDDIKVDVRLVNLYTELHSFQEQNVGTGYRFENHHRLVEETIALLKHTIGVEQQPPRTWQPSLPA